MTSVNVLNHLVSNFNKLVKRSPVTIKRLFERTPKSDYFLKTKTNMLPINEYPISGWPIHSDAKSYSLIECRKYSDPTFFREITTFYNKNGHPIKKYFLDNQFNNKIRSYKYSEALTEEKLPVKIKEINVQKYINKGRYNLIDKNELKLSVISGNWQKTSDELQAFASIDDKNKKLSIFKTIYDKNELDLTTSITEYSLVSAQNKSKNKPKNITASISKLYDGYVLKDIKKDNDTVLSDSDEFLVYRLLPDQEKCIGLTKHFLKRIGLGNLGINVTIPSSKVRNKALAHFSTYDREIGWRIVPKDRNIVEIAAHESEHAYQHAQIGRLGTGFSAYEKDCEFVFGKISNPFEKQEAQKYYEACMNYPCSDDVNYSKKHAENYLEMKADLAAKKAMNEYTKGQKILKNIFKYFPDDNNLF